MARFRCRACGKEGTFVYDGDYVCPSCGSMDVQFALSIEELPDDDPLLESSRGLVEKNEKED